MYQSLLYISTMSKAQKWVIEFHHYKATSVVDVWTYTGEGAIKCKNATKQDLKGFERLAKKHNWPLVKKCILE